MNRSYTPTDSHLQGVTLMCEKCLHVGVFASPLCGTTSTWTQVLQHFGNHDHNWNLTKLYTTQRRPMHASPREAKHFLLQYGVLTYVRNASRAKAFKTARCVSSPVRPTSLSHANSSSRSCSSSSSSSSYGVLLRSLPVTTDENFRPAGARCRRKRAHSASATGPTPAKKPSCTEVTPRATHKLLTLCRYCRAPRWWSVNY